MKLRLLADSIRLRLTRSEVQALCEGREIAETCALVPVPLTYALRPDPEASGLTARSDGARLTLTIPTEWLHHWDSDERVGFETKDGSLRLLVEKDFQCAHTDDPSENIDRYAHPQVKE